MATVNHNLNQPNEGEENWDVPINENFDSLDTLLQAMSGDGTSLSGLSSIDTDEIDIGHLQPENTKFAGATDDLPALLSDFSDYDTVVLYEDYVFEPFEWAASGTLVILPSATLSLADGWGGNYFIQVTASEIEITGGGTLDFNGANVPADSGANFGVFATSGGDGFHIHDLTIVNASSPAIRVDDFSDVRIDDNHVESCNVFCRVGSGAQAVGNISVCDNTFEGLAADPKGNPTRDIILIWGDKNGDGTPIDNVDVSGNRVTGAWSTIQDPSGEGYFWFINLERGARSATVTGNTAQSASADSAGGFIRAGGEVGTARDFTVTGNVARGTTSSNGARGIQLSGGPNTCTGNTMRGFPGSNIHVFVDDSVVVGNNANGDITDGTAGAATIANNG